MLTAPAAWQTGPALVPPRIPRPVQLRAARPVHPPHIVPGHQLLRVQAPRQRGQIGELHCLVAAHAGHRRLALRIPIREVLDHRFAEPSLRVDHVMRDAKLVRHPPRVMDILPGAAAPSVPWPCHGHQCSVTPITSCPAARISAAATALSTPPDIAATTGVRADRNVAAGAPDRDDRGAGRVGGQAAPWQPNLRNEERRRASSQRCRAAWTARWRLALMRAAGHEVIGVTLQLYDHGAAIGTEGRVLRRAGHP